MVLNSEGDGKKAHTIKVSYDARSFYECYIESWGVSLCSDQGDLCKSRWDKYFVSSVRACPKYTGLAYASLVYCVLL